MKILYLHQYFVTPDMAGGTRSYEMARRLVAAGHEVYMLTSDQQVSDRSVWWKETVEDGIQVHWAGVRYNNNMGFVRRLYAFIEFAVRSTLRGIKLDADVIFATSTPLTIAIPALLISGWKKCPFVFEVRDMWPAVPIAIGAIRNPLLINLSRWLESITYRRARHIIALAPGMGEDIIAGGVDRNKVTIIPNACDVALFSKVADAGSPREEYPWLKNRKLALYAGTIGQVNGVGFLVHLAAELEKMHSDICIVVIGGGKESEHINMLARQAGVLDVNFFMLEAMPKRDIVRWLQTADIHLALFTGPEVIWKDAVQNKFFDALATGKPIAGNFDGWQTRISLEYKVGLMLDPRDHALAAQQLSDAVHNSEWLAQVPERALALANDRFSREKLVKELEKVLINATAHAD